jgi:hypothetical protein
LVKSARLSSLALNRRESPNPLAWPGSSGKWFNLAANAASVFGLVVTLFVALRWDATALLLIYVCGLSASLLWRYVRQERWARYAEVQSVLERVYKHVDDSTDYLLFADNLAASTQSLKASLDEMANAFTLVTGAPCRVCIVETYLDSGPSGSGTLDWYARVLWRSHVDRAEPGDPHLVSKNTDFLATMSTALPYFSNDLIRAYWDRHYDNSKWTESAVRSGDVEYFSAIVLPVTIEAHELTQAPRVIGFVCVDSRRRRAFEKYADVAMGACYAHAVYPVMRKMLDAGQLPGTAGEGADQ